MKVYKLRNKATGMYWCGYKMYKGKWSYNGKFYWRLSDLKNSFTSSDEHPEDWELIIWQLPANPEIQPFSLDKS